MGVTKSLDGGAVWGRNYITTSTVIAPLVGSGASLLSNYPVSNLANPLRTKTNRVTFDETNDTYSITFTFNSSVSVTNLAVAFVDWNLPAQNSVPVTIAGLAGSTSPSWLVYPYATDNGVCRYYLDAKSSGSTITGATSWKVIFDANSVGYGLDGFLEIGEIVFSTYIDVDISTPFARTLVNPSVYATSYGGQEYADEKNMFNNIGVNTTPMNSTEMYTLQESIKQIGSAHTILDIHASSASTDGAYTTPVVLDKESTYYGRLKNGIKASIKGFNNAGLGLSFSEARK